LLPIYVKTPNSEWSGERRASICGRDASLTYKGMLIEAYFPSTSVGNMHSTRSSCAVMHCSVPRVVISEKYEKRWSPRRKTMGSTGVFVASDVFNPATPGYLHSRLTWSVGVRCSFKPHFWLRGLPSRELCYHTPSVWTTLPIPTELPECDFVQEATRVLVNSSPGRRGLKR